MEKKTFNLFLPALVVQRTRSNGSFARPFSSLKLVEEELQCLQSTFCKKSILVTFMFSNITLLGPNKDELIDYSPLITLATDLTN